MTLTEKLASIAGKRHAALADLRRIEQKIARLKDELRKALYDGHGRDTLVSRKIRKDLERSGSEQIEIQARLSDSKSAWKNLMIERSADEHSGFCEIFMNLAREKLEPEIYHSLAREAHERFKVAYELFDMIEEANVPSP